MTGEWGGGGLQSLQCKSHLLITMERVGDYKKDGGQVSDDSIELYPVTFSSSLHKHKFSFTDSK